MNYFTGFMGYSAVEILIAVKVESKSSNHLDFCHFIDSISAEDIKPFLSV